MARWSTWPNYFRVRPFVSLICTKFRNLFYEEGIITSEVNLRAMGGNISMMASAKFFFHVEGDIDVASMVHA